MGRRERKTARKTARSAPGKAKPHVDTHMMLETASMEADEQLELLLRFLREGPDESTVEPWSSRLKGLALRPVHSESGRLRVQWQVAVSYDTIDLPALRRLRTALAAGFGALVAEPAGAWALPRPEGLFVHRDRDGSIVWQYTHRDRSKGDDGSLTWIILAAAQLFAEHADRVRACLWCKAIFLAVKRQEYCTPQHAQLARDRKKRTSARGAKGE